MNNENIVILNFAEAKQPEYKEKRGVGYIEFGDKNDYPDYLVELFNNSSKHSALILGKVSYIIGNGWDGSNKKFIESPNRIENLHELTRKVSTDIEIFGGAYLEVIWSEFGGLLSEINHIDYTKIRTNKDCTIFWYKEDWKNYREKPIEIPCYSEIARIGKQILYIKEYRPNTKTYALPGYFSSLNYIQSDVEVSRHILGNAMTGFSPSKLITLTNGDPTDEEKRNVTKRFERAYTGSQGKKFILSFVNDASRKPIIDDLGASDLTKEDFSRIDSIIQQNIYSGHSIVSPSLFGIAEPGKLGTRNELRDAYEIFKKTYANKKQSFLESIFNRLCVLNGGNPDLQIIPLEPISYEFSEQTIVANLTKDEIREKLGLPVLIESVSSSSESISNALNALSPLVATKVLEMMTTDEIRALIGLPVNSINITPNNGLPNTTNPNLQTETNVNENIKNLSGRQHQQLLRIIRQYGQGKITREIAATLLKTGLGLNDNDISNLLGEQNFNSDDSEIDIFSEYGEEKKNFTLIKSVPYTFEKTHFEITDALNKKILEILKKEPLTPLEDIAKATKTDLDIITQKVNTLIENEIINYNTKTNERTVTKPLSEIIDKPLKTSIEVRYSYEWKPEVPPGQRDTPEHPSRPFCKKFMSLERYWTRKEIESISQRLGYSVFDRGGGWWGKNPSCRHYWASNVLIKKSK